MVTALAMLRVQRPTSGESEQDVNSAGLFGKWCFSGCVMQIKSSHTLAREDLVKLKRQYRVRDVSRKQYHEQADNALKKQQ